MGRGGGLYTNFSFSKCINKAQALLGSIGMGYLDLVLLFFPELKRLEQVGRLNRGALIPDVAVRWQEKKDSS